MTWEIAPEDMAALRAAAGAAPFHALHLCQAVDACAQPVMRHRLCTVNRVDAQRLEVVRLYSSNPQSYPPGGRKAKRGTPWGEQVLVAHRTFVGQGPEALRAAFDDHAEITRLGLQSVVNVPVVWEQQCLGTLNLLMPQASVDPSQVTFAQMLGLILLPVFLSDCS